MVSRRHALTLLGSTATVGLGGCLFGGFGAGESGPPPTVSNRRVETTGAIPQYQVGADNAGALPGAAPTDPSVAWRRTPNRYDAAQPVVDGDAVYVAFDGDLVKLALGDGEEVWTVDTGHASQSAPTVVDESVVAADETGTVRRLDATSGEEQWHATVDGRIHQSVAVGDGHVVVAHEAGVASLSLVDGDERWRTELDGDPTAPLLTDDVALVGAGRDVVAFARADGAERWRVETRERSYTDVFLSGVTGSPVAVDGTVLVATQAGDVYALDDG
jgi:outer membrane protein assembly factor BamB